MLGTNLKSVQHKQHTVCVHDGQGQIDLASVFTVILRQNLFLCAHTLRSSEVQASYASTLGSPTGQSLLVCLAVGFENTKSGIIALGTNQLVN